MSEKIYVGITSRKLETRWKEHLKISAQGNGYRLGAAIRKHGRESFVLSVLKICTCRDEALLAEISFIADLKPEYNSTKGGDGTSGVIFSQVTREIMRQKRLKNPNRYWLGKKRSPETKEKISATKLAAPYKPPTEKAMEARRKNFKRCQESKLRKVRCVDDGKEFDSITNAANFYGVMGANITSVCRGRIKTASGKRFEYVEGAASW